jgi:2-keto-3-deoxy-L-rhamnonate aldolase RhmA
VPGITFAYVGMHDLTLSMGCPGDFRNADALAGVERVVAAAKEHGISVGLSQKGLTVQELWKLGARMLITPTGEYTVLLEGYQARINEARAAIAELAEVPEPQV